MFVFDVVRGLVGGAPGGRHRAFAVSSAAARGRLPRLDMPHDVPVVRIIILSFARVLGRPTAPDNRGGSYLSSAEHSVHLRLSLLEGSECGVNCDASWPGRSLENYVSFQPLLLDDTSGA